MFSLTVRGHMMIAHSLPDPFFGPAQGLHGATYVAETTFSRPELDEHGVVLDIGAAQGHLDAVLGALSYRNLDEHPDMVGQLTTTEVLARHVALRVVERMRSSDPAHGIERVQVTLREHPDAWATYEVAVADAPD
ncbi:6-pyruvoyl trahydropterin synthase family protein [Ornithinimicrobium sediminis]|uniref:6-pyruvoyl trahydropterin synthase family protein n=1 Tax=Ornithinimicrobium sediminis TaxID=2904603 RepID=UPI001E368274|nr:6-carboxytetrahydropterin synthase [Ornithinimicrobium sediminis]